LTQLAELASTLGVTDDRALELIRPLIGEEPDRNQALERFSLVCWSSLVEPGDAIARRIVTAYGATEGIARLAVGLSGSGRVEVISIAEAVSLEPAVIDSAIERWRLRFSAKQFRANLEFLARFGARVATSGDSDWPETLEYLGENEPLVLFAKGAGNLADLGRSFALVGSRVISPYGRWVTKEFCETLVGVGRPVVSGGAFGVDAAAHEFTMRAGGVTAAVLAGGFDYLYPRGNLPLFEKVQHSGLICTEVAPSFAPTRWRFLQRNRVIAALSQATVVIEAGYRSGSINTANHAAAIGRPVGAVPGPISASHSSGCHKLIRDSKATLLGTTNELLALVDPARESGETHRELTDEQLRVFDTIARNATEETIAQRAGMSVRECQLLLAQLEIEGFVARNNQKWTRLSRTL
jgi:DNA processing protein